MNIKVTLNNEDRWEDTVQITLGFHEMNRLVNQLIPMLCDSCERHANEETERFIREWYSTELTRLNKLKPQLDDALTEIINH